MLLRHAPQRRSVDSHVADQPTHDVRGGCHAPQSHACSIRRKALLAALRKAPSRWCSETVRPAIGGRNRMAFRPGTPQAAASGMMVARPPPRKVATTDPTELESIAIRGCALLARR